MKLILGILGRIPIVWLFIMNFSIMYRNVNVANAEEQVLSMLLFFSLFLPLNCSLTIKSLINKDKRKKMFEQEKITVWALKPLQVQFALIYLLSSPHKFISDPAWIDGTMVYWFIIHRCY